MPVMVDWMGSSEVCFDIRQVPISLEERLQFGSRGLQLKVLK